VANGVVAAAELLADAGGDRCTPFLAGIIAVRGAASPVRAVMGVPSAEPGVFPPVMRVFPAGLGVFPLSRAAVGCAMAPVRAAIAERGEGIRRLTSAHPFRSGRVRSRHAGSGPQMADFPWVTASNHAGGARQPTVKPPG